MAKLDFNTTKPVDAPAQSEVSQPVQTPIIETSKDDVVGLSTQEINDPNSITVTIADPNVPVVVLFGPTECGKTMTLIRLTRFLRQQGFRVSPVRSFRPAQDTHYAEMCGNYNNIVDSNDAAESTPFISFMLVDVLTDNGKCICKILEAPGEYYYNRQKPNNSFPTYINTIINSDNRKVWVFMVEPDWFNPADRNGYVGKVHALKTQMRANDKAIFLYNKVDKSHFVISPGKVNVTGVMNDIKNMYPGMFVKFLNQNPLTRWFSPYRFSLVPFSTGTYNDVKNTDGTMSKKFTEGPAEYPAILWNTIQKRIRG